jgi:hypothetical protein
MPTEMAGSSLLILSKEYHMSLDSGTINLMNRIAAKRPMLLKNLRMLYRGIEVEGDCQITETEPYSSGGVKVVSDIGASFLDGADVVCLH